MAASAASGVLFIDEAYSLAGDQYGQESVDTLVKEMEDRRDDLVLIVAGYPDPMAIFIAQNPGLASRFRTTIEFSDYTDEELVRILKEMARAADYDLDDACVERFSAILAMTPRGPIFGNGRFAQYVGSGDWRARLAAARGESRPTVEQLRKLIPEDFDRVGCGGGAASCHPRAGETRLSTLKRGRQRPASQGSSETQGAQP